MIYLLFFLSLGLATALALVIKKSQQQNKNYSIAQQKLKETDRKYGGIISREDAVKKLDDQIAFLTDQLKKINQQAREEEQQLPTKILTLKTKLQGLEEQELVEAFGFYESKYDFYGSEEYKQRLDKIRSQQKQMIKVKQAAICLTEWSVGGSVKEGKKMTDNFLKLVLRAFNGECDVSVVKAKYNNVQTMENRIRKAYGDLNKLSQTTNCEITSHYLELKLQVTSYKLQGVRPLVDKRWYNQVSTGNPY